MELGSKMASGWGVRELNYREVKRWNLGVKSPGERGEIELGSKIKVKRLNWGVKLLWGWGN